MSSVKLLSTNTIARQCCWARGRWHRHRVGFMAGIVFAAMCAAPAPATAATWWWNTLTTGLWTNGANWSNAASGGSTGTAPTNDTTTDVVVFNTTGTNGAIVSQLSQDQSIGGIAVNNTGATTLQGDSATTRQLSLGVGGVTVNSGAGAFTIGTTGSLVNIAIAGSQTWTNNSSSPLTMSSGTLSSSVAGTQTLTIAGSGSTTFGSVLANGSGTLALAKTGAGTLTLTALSTFTGGLTVTGGTLALLAQSGTGPIQANQNFSITNATLTTTGSFHNALGRQPGGWTSGTATINAGGLLYAGNTQANSHNLFDVVLSGGTMGAGAGALDGALANFYIAGSITATGSTASTISASLGRQSGTIPNTTLPIAVDAGSTLTVSGQIVNLNGANGLTKTGDGLLTLSGSNSYSGGTTISGGLLRLGNARALGGTGGALTVSGGGLELNGNSITTGSVSITAAAFTGDTIQSGTLTGSSYTVSNTSGNAVISAVLAGSGGVDKSGAGTLTLSAANTYSGITTFSGGTINVGSLSNLGANGSLGNRANDIASVGILFRGGVLQYTGSTAQSTNRAIRVGLQGATLDASGSSPEATMSFTATSSPDFFENPGARTVTFTGSNTGNNTFAMTIGDAGGTGVVKSGQGTWVLSGSSAYTAGTTISGGLLRVGNARALGATTGALTVSGGRLDLNGNSITTGAVSITVAATTGDTIQSGTLTGSSYTVSNPSGNAVISAVLAGSGGVSKSGAGTLTLSAANTYSGVTTLTSGTVNVASLSNYGANGSLGNRAIGGDTSGNVGLLFNGGVLQYTGSTAQTTNRAIRVGLGGATLDASGSSPEATMSFTATSSPAFFSDAGSRTVTFTGSNAGNNTFAMNIVDIAGTTNTSVVKSGQGKWVLSGSSSYTGGTQVNGGTLSLGHASALGNSGTISFGGGVLQFSSSNTTDYSNRFSTAANQAYAIDTNGQTVSFAAGLTSSGGSLTKLGTGLLVLSASSSYNGGTSITAGTLRAANARAFGSGTITLASGATLDINNLAVANTITSNGGTILNAASFTGTTALTSGTTALQSVGGSVDIDASAVADLSGTINAVVTVKAGGRGRASGQIQKNVTVNGGGQFDILNDATIDEAASFSFANNGQIYIDRTNNLALSKVISGTGGLRKSGNSRVTLTGANTFTGATQIDAGTLVVNGALAGDVTVALGATLGGSGVLGDMLSGAGTISVGNSPGIGTAASVEPFAGTDWVFEITGSAPTWNAGASASVNDVLRLTDVTPFASSLAPGNVVDVLFNLTSGGPVGQGDYLGGFFIDNESFNLAAALAGGTFRYWVAGEYGTVGQRQQFNVGTDGAAVWYSPLAAYDSSLSASYTISQQTVNFGAGNVTGAVTQFIVVPEPSTALFAVIGIAVRSWSHWKRRRITKPTMVI